MTRIILILSLLILVLAGCSLKFWEKDKPVADPDAWKTEVLWADECGQDGMACCVDQAEQCKYGAVCCADPNHPERSRCQKSCESGIVGRFCSSENKCAEGSVCVNGDCAKCGGKDEPCCGSEKCGDGLICHAGRCLACGELGSPCCQAGQSCVKQKDGSRSECLADICALCGSEAQPACPSDPACSNGFLKNGNECLTCGGPNQPCCNENSITPYNCDPAKGLICNLGFCQ